MKAPGSPAGGRNGQRGATLVELVVSVAVVGLIAAPLGVTISQVFKTTVWGSQETAVLGALQTAVTWLAHDIPSASSNDLPDGGPAQSSIAITSTDLYGGTTTSVQVSYALVGTELRRTQDGVTHTVAWNVTAISFLRSGSLVTVTITLPSATSGTVQAEYLFNIRNTW